MSVDGIERLAVGISVDIQRTDGRVHSAVVSGVNIQTRSVTVEWFEKGEAKGKEIEFEQILQFNPGLLQDESPDEQISDRNCMGGGISSREPPLSKPNGVTPSGGSSQRSAVPAPSRIRAPGVNGRPATQHTSAAQPNFNAAPPSLAEIPHESEHPGGPPSPVQTDFTFMEDVSPTDYDASNIRKPSNGAGDWSSRSSNSSFSFATCFKVAKNRKSNTVKEIERIQQRRDERRAAQKAIREQPDFDPSNPNYEFLQMIREHQEKLDYQPLTENDPVEDHRICVCVRKRPLNKKEIGRKEIDVNFVPTRDTVIVHEPKHKVDLTKYLENHEFRYDYAFEETVSNEMVYKYTAKPLVECIFEGGMATCFAYGQTGSGKTHTMGGEFQGKGVQDCSKGIYALAARDVFKLLNSKYKKDNLYVEAAFFEIYSGKVFDLLNKKEKLRVLEDGKNIVNVVGLKMQVVESVDDVLRLLQHGNLIRTSGTTSANQHSSRSHAVFQMILKKRATKKLHGKFSLIDLAGNERGADTSSSDRLTRMEGAEINKSLLALKECIRALGKKGAHTPFRASKLTQVLRDSFIGDKSRTCMIATISPGFSCCEHTLNTLRYADRVKELEIGGSSSGPGGENSAISGVGGLMGRPAQEKCLLNEEEEDDYLLDDDDLAMLKDDTITDEMMTVQEVFSHIEKMEEQVCDEHRSIVEVMNEWNAEHKKLYNMSNQVGYNMEDYGAKLEQLLSTQISKMMSLRDNVAAWNSEMKQEEEINNQLLRKKEVNKKK